MKEGSDSEGTVCGFVAELQAAVHTERQEPWSKRGRQGAVLDVGTVCDELVHVLQELSNLRQAA